MSFPELFEQVQVMRVALIAMLWNVAVSDEDESCDGDCEDDGEHPYPACQAMRALGYGQHYTKAEFERQVTMPHVEGL